MSTIRKLFAGLALASGFICLLALIYAFTSNPDLLVRGKNAISLFVQGTMVSVIVGFLVKQLRKRLKQTQSLTKALISLVSDEPLLHTCIWIFNIFVLVYVLPIHRIKPKLHSVSGKSINLESGQIRLWVKGRRLPIESHALRWGTPARLILNTDEFDADTVNVPWSAFAVFDVFRGVQVPLLARPVMPDSVRIMLLSVSPQDAQVVAWVNDRPIFQGAGNVSFKVKKDQLVKIELVASCHQTWNTAILAKQDTSLPTVVLKEQPGKVTLVGVSAGGTIVPNMSVYLDGNLLNQQSGRKISLPPKNYKVKLVWQEGGGYVIESNEVNVRVEACKSLEKRIRVSRKSS